MMVLTEETRTAIFKLFENAPDGADWDVWKLARVYVENGVDLNDPADGAGALDYIRPYLNYPDCPEMREAALLAARDSVFIADREEYLRQLEANDDPF